MPISKESATPGPPLAKTFSEKVSESVRGSLSAGKRKSKRAAIQSQGDHVMNEHTMVHLQAVAKKSVGGAVIATAIGAMGFLTAPVPAQAHPMLPFPLAPACSQWGFPGNFSLKQSNGDTVTFNATGPVASGPAQATGGTNGSFGGEVSGGIQGDKLDLRINWGVVNNQNSQGHYTGTVGNDGIAHGDTHDEFGNAGDGSGGSFSTMGGPSAHWDSTVPLVCSTPAAAPVAPAAPPKPPTTVVQKAPDVQLPNVAVAPPSATPGPPPKALQGPTVSATPGLAGVTFHVTDRSGVASRCTYSSEGFTSDSFALPANGSFDLFVPAIREFRIRTGTITCDNGTSAPTSVNF